MLRRSFLLSPLLAGAQPRPNIILFLADDLGSGDLSSYGALDIRTPNIDALGRRGARFTQFYASAPECTPTRAALLTGRYPHRAGGLECAIGVGDQGRYADAVELQKRGELGLPASETSLAKMLREVGYDTAVYGKWHLGYPKKFWPAAHGFDDSLGILGGNADYFSHREEDGRPVLFEGDDLIRRDGSYTTDLIADEAVNWLRRRTERPYFLYVPFTAPHTPLQDPDAPSRKVAARDRGIYAKMVERMDAAVERVLAAAPRRERTIVLFTSDNGADPNGSNSPLRGYKSSVWEGGIRAPLLVEWPRVVEPRRVVDQVSITTDITATLLAAAGVAPARPLDGIDLAPWLRGRARSRPRTLFWRYRRGQNLRRAVRDGSWKYVDDNGHEELHDLALDPFEQKNLLSAQAARAQAMRTMLARWEEQVRAPRP